jgi:hypothetical protein
VTTEINCLSDTRGTIHELLNSIFSSGSFLSTSNTLNRAPSLFYLHHRLYRVPHKNSVRSPSDFVPVYCTVYLSLFGIKVNQAENMDLEEMKETV